MKVALITDAPLDKDFRALRTLEALKQMGVTGVVIDQGMNQEEAQKVLPEGFVLKSPQVPVAGMARMNWHAKNRLAPRAAQRERSEHIAEVISEVQPNVVHCCNPFGLRGALDGAQATGAKLIYEPYEYWPDYAFDVACRIPAALAKKLMEDEKSAAIEGAALITVSDPIAHWYQELYGYTSTYVVYNANVPDGEAPDEARPVHRPLKCVFSGQLIPDRNIDKMIRAIMQSSSTATLDLYGDGVSRASLVSLGDELLGTRFTWHAPVPAQELTKHLAAYDFGLHLVSPGTKQMDGALPNKIFDYIRAGLGVITIDSPGVRSAEKLQDALLFVDDASHDALGKQILYLERNPRVGDALKASACEAAREFTQSKQIQGLKDYYGSIMQNAGEESC